MKVQKKLTHSTSIQFSPSRDHKLVGWEDKQHATSRASVPLSEMKRQTREPLLSIPQTLCLSTTTAFEPIGTNFGKLDTSVFSHRKHKTQDISHPPVSYHQKSLSFPFPLPFCHLSLTLENLPMCPLASPSISNKSPCILSLFSKYSIYVLGVTTWLALEDLPSSSPSQMFSFSVSCWEGGQMADLFFLALFKPFFPFF